MAKTNGKISDIVPLSKYQISQTDIAQIGEIVRTNCGDTGLSRFDLDNIHIPTGGGTLWQIPSLTGDEQVPHIDCVVIGFRDGRAYWEKAVGDGGNAPPDCSSDNGKVGVGNPGGDCATCPYSKFGTKPKSDGSMGRGQACKSIRLLFVMRQTGVLPTVIALAPTSVKECATYFRRLAGAQKFYFSVMTRVSLDKDKNADGIAYSVAKFSLLGELTEDEVKTMQQLHKVFMPSLATVKVRDFVEQDAEESGAGTQSPQG